MTVTILCNGDFPQTEYPRYLLTSADLVVCCDGAAQTLARTGICGCDIIIGDLDSVDKTFLDGCTARIEHVTEQEDNDMTKAMKYILAEVFPKCSADEEKTVHILGATGKREAHTIGNLSLLMEYEKRFHLSEQGISLDMVSDYSSMFVITDSTFIDCGEGQAVSIMTCDPSVRIKSSGLEWPTDNVVFDLWWKATLNRAVSDRITLTLSHPAPVLIILG